MKLIYITRKVDRQTGLTGFVFDWINQFSKLVDHLDVICQEQGDISGLPANVSVHSFGKDKGYGKLKQAWRLFKLVLDLSNNADGIFCAQYPVYAIVAALAAKMNRRKIILWYTHKSVDLKLRIAHALASEVFTASRESFRLPSQKVKVVGHGIDLAKFKPGGSKPEGKFKIISVGRISPVKDYETLIKAIEILVNHKNITDLEVKIYGTVGFANQQPYFDSLINFAHNAELEDIVKFEGQVAHEYVPEILREADLFVNLSMTGSIDKAVLEAAASGVPAMSSNEAFAEPLKSISSDLFFERNNPADLAEKILRLKNAAPGFRTDLGESLRAWVVKEHNLDNLVKKIVQEFES